MNPYIYIWNHGNILRMSIKQHPFLYLCQAKNGTLAKYTLETTDLKLGMYTQLDSVVNMGRVSPGHTSPSVSIRLKLVYTYVCMFVCIHFITKTVTYTISNITNTLIRGDTSHSMDVFIF